jgi:hypothetical protein
MGILQIALSQLEARLQALIEGSAARLFPGHAWYDLAQYLVSAIQSDIQLEPDGTLLAPNQFTIIVHPSQERILLEEPGFLDQLAYSLQNGGREAGLTFPAPIVIKVATDPSLDVQEIKVCAKIDIREGGDTLSIPIVGGRNDQPTFSNAFLIVKGSQIFPLTGQGVNIGRRKGNHLVIDDPRVSRTHAQIRLVQGRYAIFDLDSTGGTFVNGQRVIQHVLHPGDVLSLAGVQIVFGHEIPAAMDDTQELMLPQD